MEVVDGCFTILFRSIPVLKFSIVLYGIIKAIGRRVATLSTLSGGTVYLKSRIEESNKFNNNSSIFLSNYVVLSEAEYA